MKLYYNFIIIIITAIELKTGLVIHASEEAHLEPFKGKMEAFFVQGIVLIN